MEKGRSQNGRQPKRSGGGKKGKEQLREKQIREARRNPDLRAKLRKDPGTVKLTQQIKRLDSRLEAHRKAHPGQVIRPPGQHGAGGSSINASTTNSDPSVTNTQLASYSAMKERSEARMANYMGTLAAEAGEEAMNVNDNDDVFYNPAIVDEATGQVNTVKRDAFRSVLKEVVLQSDGLVMVLDCRNPEATRCRFIPLSRVRLIVLSKADLVPPSVVSDWCKYYRNTIHIFCVPFKKGSSASKAALQTAVKLLGCKTVGIVGMPNVGKSTIVNALAYRQAVSVAAHAGHTRAITAVGVGKGVFVLDSPGVLPTKGADDADLVGIGAIDPDRVVDPIDCVERLSKLSTDVPTPVDYARERGMIGAGGVLRVEEAAKDLLRRWQRGEFIFYAKAPGTDTASLAAVAQRREEAEMGGVTEEQTVLVDKLAREFNVDALIESLHRRRDDTS